MSENNPTPTDNGNACFETRDGVQGVALFGPPVPLEDGVPGYGRCGRWRELTNEELLIIAAAKESERPPDAVIVDVFKAQPTISSQPVKSLVLRACEAIPEAPHTCEFDSLPAWERAVRQRYEEEGQAIADALLIHLPGGTVDQVLCALLRHRASLFAVPFTERQPEVATYATPKDPDLAEAQAEERRAAITWSLPGLPVDDGGAA